MLRKAAIVLFLLAAGALRADPLFSVLAGEFALQSGRHREAAAHYLDAALAARDAALTERAARIGLLAGDAALAGQALAHWDAFATAAEAESLRQLRASVAMERGDVAAAIEDLQALFAAGDAGVHLAMQALAADSHAMPSGLVLRELLRREALPDLPDVWVGLGLVARRHQQGMLALDLAQRAVQRFPQEARMRLWLAEERLRAGDADAARTDLDAALGHGDLAPELRLSAAALLDRLGEPGRAAEVLAVGPQDEELIGTRAALLARQDSLPALESLYHEVQQLDGEATPARRLLLGQLAELVERDAEAQRWYRSVVESPQRARAQLRLAVLLDRGGEGETALAQLRELQLDTQADVEAVRDAYLLEAELLLRRQADAEALEAYGRGLQVIENDPRLLYGRALASERLDRVDEAVADLELLVALDPNNPDHLNALGYTLVDRTDRHAEGLALIERALALHPESAAIVDSHGWALYRMGRLEEAEAELRRAFELQPDPEIAAHLGEVLWMRGKQDEARAVWEQGRALEADNRVLLRTLQRLAE